MSPFLLFENMNILMLTQLMLYPGPLNQPQQMQILQ